MTNVTLRRLTVQVGHPIFLVFLPFLASWLPVDRSYTERLELFVGVFADNNPNRMSARFDKAYDF